MSNLNAYGVAVDVELFDLIELSYKYKSYSRQFIKRVTDFVLKNDHISGCFLITVMPYQLCSKLVDYDKNDVFLTYVVKFIKVHSVPKIMKMLEARYGDELRRVELRVSAEAYANILRSFGK